MLSSDADYPLTLTGPVNIAPMTVNSSIKVANLNADQLDGKTSADFVLNETVVGHFNCHGSALFPVSSSGTYGTAYGRTADSASGTFGCALVLPDGATITELRAYVRDTSASEELGPCTILEMTLATAAQSAIAITGYSGVAFAGGSTTLSDTLSTGVNNATKAYVTECGILGTGSDVSIQGIQVTYSVTGLPIP